MIEGILGNQWVLLGAFIGLIALFVLIFRFILRRVIDKTAEKFEFSVDVFKVKKITRLVYALLALTLLFFAITSLPVYTQFTEWINSVFFVIGVLLVSLLVSRLSSLGIEHWLKAKGKLEQTPELLEKLVTILVYLFALAVIMFYFQIELTPIIAALGIGGLAASFALQGTLSNFFAGAQIVSDRPVNVGDYVELPREDIEGYVEDVGWRSTRIRTLPNTVIVVPNSKLSDSIIINHAQPEDEMAALVNLGVAYDSDLEKVEKVTIEVGKKIQKEVTGAVEDFEPFIRFNEFGEYNIKFTVILRVQKFVDKYLVVHEFIKALKKRYEKEGIKISLPARIIYQSNKKRK